MRDHMSTRDTWTAAAWQTSMLVILSLEMRNCATGEIKVRVLFLRKPAGFSEGKVVTATLHPVPIDGSEFERVRYRRYRGRVTIVTHF